MNKIGMSRIGLIGKKLGMTQLFDDEGRRVPVTVLEVGPCHVTDLCTQEKHGYNAVQLGFGPAKEKRVNRAKKGHLKKSGAPALRFLREIRTEEIKGLAVGQKLKVDNFEVGDFVDVEATSVGRGFQGVVKRHHFKGGASKGHGSMFGRVPGSIGASSFPSRVVKGMRAAGHMGNAQTTIQNLRVVKVDQENNLLVVRGSVPGFEGECLLVRTALKRGKPRQWKVPNAAEESSKVASPAEEAKPESSESKS